MMFFAYWMILVAALVPYGAVAYAKRGEGDNRAPRLDAEKLTGPRQRAEWAHRNHFEVFPLFAAAVIVAGITGAAHTTMNLLAGSYVVLRILYTFAYIGDRPTLRSLLFMGGALCIVGLFVAAGMA
jgi:uncharacterized MAPEG superfamily protein